MFVNESVLDVLRKHRVRMAWGLAGSPKLGEKISCHVGAEVESYTTIAKGNTLPRRMGAFSYSHSTLPVDSEIGRFCSIASEVRQMGDKHPIERISSSPFTYHRNYMVQDYLSDHQTASLSFRPFKKREGSYQLGHDVWIGADVLIAQGVKIGTGAIVAARAVVTKDVPEYSIVAGVPAKLLRFRFSKDIIDALLKSEWWNYPIEALMEMDPLDPLRFTENLENRVKSGGLSRMEYRILTYQALAGAAGVLPGPLTAPATAS
jgi:acetyltransferase-like isoleucine patch superfamily enzyme